MLILGNISHCFEEEDLEALAQENKLLRQKLSAMRENMARDATIPKQRFPYHAGTAEELVEHLVSQVILDLFDDCPYTTILQQYSNFTELATHYIVSSVILLYTVVSGSDGCVEPHTTMFY